jgi:hypothetical protein
MPREKKTDTACNTWQFNWPTKCQGKKRQTPPATLGNLIGDKGKKKTREKTIG